MSADTQEATSLRERCFDSLLRVDRIVHFDTMAGDAPSSDTIEFAVENQDVLAEAYGWDAEDMDDEEMEEAITEQPVTGWLIEVHTPMRDRWPLFSWGVTTFKVFHHETYEGALDKAFAWVGGMGKDGYTEDPASQPGVDPAEKTSG